jgi:hypothetical protein
MTANSVHMVYEYSALSHLYNSVKHKMNSEYPELIVVPFSFNVEKIIDITDALTVKTLYENTSRYDSFRFAAGEQPAFAYFDDPENCWFEIFADPNGKEPENKILSLKEVIEKGDYVVESSHVRFFRKDNSRGVEVESTFNKTQLWSPKGSNLVGIEPITETLDANLFLDLSERFNDSPGVGSYKDTLKPGEYTTRRLTVRLF